MAEPYNIDADVENADWPKRRWDIDGTPEQQATFIMGEAGLTPDEYQRNINRFMRTPAARAMPRATRAALEKKGFHVPNPSLA